MKNTTKKLSIKVLMFCTSFILSVFFLEVGMRTLGLFLKDEGNLKLLSNYETDTSYEIHSSPKKTINKNTILCIGDSFTNGGNLIGDWGSNYPYFLSKKLNSLKYSHQILNMGLCEDTTYGIYHRILDYLNSNPPPKYIIALAGSADTFHLKANEDYSKLTWINPKSAVDSIRKNWFYNLRVYKMYRHIKFTIEHNILLLSTETKNKQEIKRFAKEYENQISLNKTAEATETLNKVINFINSNFEDDEILKHRFFEFRDVLEPMVETVANSNLKLNHYNNALKDLINIANKIPLSWSVYGMQYLTFQIFKKQNQFSATEVLDSFSKLGPNMENKDIKKIYDSFKNIEHSEKIIDSRRLEIWGKIYELSQAYGFQLILQNYPSNYPSPNKILKSVAKKYNLPFINNRKIFKELIEKEGRDKYLRGDEHCTPLGYQIIAKNVKNVIQKLESLKN